MTICDILIKRASECPDQQAYAFIENRGRQLRTLSYRELYDGASAIAAELQNTTSRQSTVGCMFQPGLDFVLAFFGTLLAGRIVVPLAPPRPRQGLAPVAAIAQNAGLATILTNDLTLANCGIDTQHAALPNINWLDIGLIDRRETVSPASGAADIAILQYTSGSTGTPKGVVVGHDNLLANSSEIAKMFGHGQNSVGVIWLPPHHDMGLIGGIVQPLYVGFPVYLMSPSEFIRSPMTWLGAISKYRATTSGGPNFGYETCVARISEEKRATLDLSSWDVAFCGAEPISPRTLTRFADTFNECGFSPSAFMPCYGLAEATLMVTAGEKGAGTAACEAELLNGIAYTSCGAPAKDGQVSIRDPNTGTPLPEGEVGEVWAGGPSVARGYWQDEIKSREVFTTVQQDRILRTGDLGFSLRGNLYICGRAREILIIRGINHFPEDIEATAQGAHAATQGHQCLVVTAKDEVSTGLVILQELPPAARLGAERVAIVDAIIENVSSVHGLAVVEVHLLPIGRLPRTTSGKLKRNVLAKFSHEEFGNFLVGHGLDTQSAQQAEAAEQALD